MVEWIVWPTYTACAVLLPLRVKASFWVRRTDGLCYAALPVSAAECPRREYGNVRFRLLRLREELQP
jgi:hypothetical protein